LETPPDWVRLRGLSSRGREVLRNRNDEFCLISGGNGPAGALSRQEQVGDDLYMLFAADYQTTKSWARHSKSIYFKEKIEKALAK
jgi:hypothetical protein